jgi:hypothetical protein
MRQISNRFISLTVDAKGRIVSLVNRTTHTELIAHPAASEAWRMIVPTGRHTIDIIYGSSQRPPRIETKKTDREQSLIISYDGIRGAKRLRIKARFIITLGRNSRELSATAEIDNRSGLPIDEVEFPVVGGMSGFASKGKRAMNLVAGNDKGTFHNDVLNRGLPALGREADHFARDPETFMHESDGSHGAWLDFWAEKQGVYFGYYSADQQPIVFKVEKHPKERPNAPAHWYPAGTPRWLRCWAIHLPRLRSGAKWSSDPVVIMPHAGAWHAGADRYSIFRHKNLKGAAAPPAWMEDFVGWSEILGKIYTGEVFHDFRRCADEVIRDKKTTGLNFVFYYGHTALGAEGADFDQGPDPAMGGEKGFRRMIDRLHKNGCRVMLLDHFHRYVNRDAPEFRRLRLARCANLDGQGGFRTSRWWKETALSCRRLEGPTPVWIEMCPGSEEWLEHYLRHVRRMIERGVDGLELDCFMGAAGCFNPRHSHPPGAEMLPIKLDFMRKVRAEALALDPDFLFIGEAMSPDAAETLDGFYPDRYPNENGRIYRYMFPELRRQAVLVGNYAYDAVNKALTLGIGVDTEICGLRKITRTACPELADYIGEVNRFKRKYPALMIRGTFRDTVGAHVAGGALYSVLDGPNGSRALVLRNPHPRPVACEAALDGVDGRRLSLWQPCRGERPLGRMPFRVTLPPYHAAVAVALGE